MKIEEILRSLNIPFRTAGEHHHARSGWYQLDCPYCSPNTERFRLGINAQFLYCNCWTCSKLNLIEVLHEITRQGYGELKKLLKDVEKQETPERREHHGKLKIPAGVRPLLAAHRDYLRERGFRPYTIEKLWGVQGYGPVGKLHWRILIPIVYRGRTVSWTSRTISPNESRRYISAKPEEEDIPHKELLYGEDYCRHTIIVCEGPVSAWAIGPGATATMGLSFTQAQLLKISKYLEKVICFDNEPAAQQRARQLCDQLDGFPGRVYNIVLSGKDANSTDPREIAEIRKKFLDG